MSTYYSGNVAKIYETPRRAQLHILEKKNRISTLKSLALATILIGCVIASGFCN